MSASIKANTVELELKMEAKNSEAGHELTIEDAEKLVAKMSQEKLELTEKLAQRTYDRHCTICRLRNLKRHERQLGHCLTEEREKLPILQVFSDKLCVANNAHQEKPITACSAVREIAKHKMHFQILHGTNSLAEEKQLLKETNVSRKEDVGPFSSPEIRWWILTRKYEIDQRSMTENCLRELRDLERRKTQFGILLQRQRDEAIGNARAIFRGKIWNSLGSQKSLKDQIKLTGKEIGELTRLLLAARAKMKQAERDLRVTEKDIECLKKKMSLKDQRKDEAHQCILKLRKLQSVGV